MISLNKTIKDIKREVEIQSSSKYVVLYRSDTESVLKHLERLKELRLKYKNLRAKIKRFLKKYMVNYMGDKPWEF